MPEQVREILRRGDRVEMTASGRDTFIHRPPWRTQAATVRRVSEDGYTVWVRRDGHQQNQKWAANHWRKIGLRTYG